MVRRERLVKISDNLDLRQEGGAILKQMREGLGLSQTQFALLVAGGKTFVSMVETGRTRIPSDQVPLWAKALQVEVRGFTKLLMRFNDPLLFTILFGEEAPDLLHRVSGAMDRTADEVPLEKKIRTDIPGHLVSLHEQMEVLAGLVREVTAKVDHLADRVDAAARPADSSTSPPKAARSRASSRP